MAVDTTATSIVFRASLALGFALLAYGIGSLIFAVLRARSGNANIDEVAASMTLAIKCVFATVMFVVLAFLARMLMRRIARRDA